MKSNVLLLLLCLAQAFFASGGCSESNPTSADGDGGNPLNQSAAAPAAFEDEHPARFRDVTDATGVTSVYRNGEQAQERSIVESLGGGVAMIDYDRDGRLDLVFPGGGTISSDQPLAGLPTTLWRNQGDLSFEERSHEAAIHESRYYSHGCVAADYNQDGFVDVLLTGYGGLQLFRNQGDGSFVCCASSVGLDDGEWSSSAAWADFNGDAHLDLYVARYVDWSWQNHPPCAATVAGKLDICAPGDFKPLSDSIYFGRGDGTFVGMAEEAGLAADGKGLGVIAADLNRDHHVDIYVANDTTNNFLYINDGHGKFRDIGLISGTAVDGNGTANGSMGLAVIDFNQDLLPDIWVTNYENESFGLYENTEAGNFLFSTNRTGVNALGGLFVGFGTVASDFDLDADEDLAVANGHVMLYPRQSAVAQEPFLLINRIKGERSASNSPRFVRQLFPPESYFSQPHRGRGLVAGDLDRDGDLDLVFSNTNEPAAILSNETQTGGRLVAVHLVGTKSNRDAIGSRVVLHTDRGEYVRHVVGGGSYLSQNPYTLHWGVQSGEQPLRLAITWPNGQKQILDPQSISQHALIVQASVPKPAN